MTKYKLSDIPKKEQTPQIKRGLLLLEEAYVHQQEQEKNYLFEKCKRVV